MAPEKILYTDGHEVTVTDSFFKVKKSLFLLKGITKHSLFVIHPDRLTPFLIFLLSWMMITLGAFRLIPKNLVPTIKLYSIQLSGNGDVLALGVGLLMVGSLMLLMMRDRYAIRIATAEGEKNVLVSSKREYVGRIQDALNRAFLNLLSPAQPHSKIGGR